MGSRFEEFRKKLRRGLKVFIKSNLTFISYIVREQTGTEEPYLKGPHLEIFEFVMLLV
jgi:hypothetical protein